MLSDIEISQQNQPEPIGRIAEKAGLCEEDLELYGRYKAKIGFAKLCELAAKPLKGKLILVTAITPTPAGEGKSTISIGLADALQLSRKKVMLALREPSLGPCFGLKGGATGGGYSQIVPMEDINLHFTGDIHAITAANNLLAAMIDNHIKQGNELHINPQSICWRRCLDLNDRALRNIEIAMGGSMTDTTQLVTRYTPDTSASVSHWGAPSPRSQAKRRGSSPDSVSLSHADGTLAPDMVRYSTSPSSASMSGMPMCRRASSRSMRSWRRSADDCEGRRTTRRHSSPAAR